MKKVVAFSLMILVAANGRSQTNEPIYDLYISDSFMRCYSESVSIFVIIGRISGLTLEFTEGDSPELLFIQESIQVPLNAEGASL